MAKVGDLLRRLQALVDDSIDTINMIDWFNQCNNSITDLLYLPTLVTIAKDEASGKFPLPSNSNGEIKILDPADVEVYSIYDNLIYFDGSDEVSTIQVTYNRLPAAIVNNIEQVPDIPPQFHDIYIFYGAMMFQHMDDEDSGEYGETRYKAFEKDYLRMRAELQKYMGKMRPKPLKWGVVR
jgi:hypothetical protein